MPLQFQPSDARMREAGAANQAQAARARLAAQEAAERAAPSARGSARAQSREAQPQAGHLTSGPAALGLHTPPPLPPRVQPKARSPEQSRLAQLELAAMLEDSQAALAAAWQAAPTTDALLAGLGPTTQLSNAQLARGFLLISMHASAGQRQTDLHLNQVLARAQEQQLKVQRRLSWQQQDLTRRAQRIELKRRWLLPAAEVLGLAATLAAVSSAGPVGLVLAAVGAGLGASGNLAWELGRGGSGEALTGPGRAALRGALFGASVAALAGPGFLLWAGLGEGTAWGAALAVAAQKQPAYLPRLHFAIMATRGIVDLVQTVTSAWEGGLLAEARARGGAYSLSQAMVQMLRDLSSTLADSATQLVKQRQRASNQVLELMRNEYQVIVRAQAAMTH